MLDRTGLMIKESLLAMVTEYEAEHDRTMQTDLGPSQVGDPCVLCLAKQVLGVKIDFGDPWLRIIGTATHAWLEDAAARYNVRHNRAVLYPERKVYPDGLLLPSGGSADLYHVDLRSVIDHKIVGRTTLQKVKAKGRPSEQYRRQAHLYGLGYSNAGVVVDHVAVAFWHRGGRLPDLYVWSEPYSDELAQATLQRYAALRSAVLSVGPAILDRLQPDPDCFNCNRGVRSHGDAADQQLAGIVPA